MRAALYARVSTTDKEQDPAPQLSEMRQYCSQRGWEFEEFSDRVSSGKLRPELERMKSLVRHGKFGTVVCRHFDRLARSARELVLLAEELEGLRVHFVSLNQQVDTTTPMGKFCFTVLAAAAELERGMIRERVKLGLIQARARGKKLGRPAVAVNLEELLGLRAMGLSLGSIARKLKVSRQTVTRLLSRLARLHSAKNPEKS